MKIVEFKFHKITDEDTEVVSRVDIHFVGFWLKGFKIIRGRESNKEYVTPPSYRSPKGWRALFATDSVDDWQQITVAVLSAYNEFLIKESADKAQETLSYK